METLCAFNQRTEENGEELGFGSGCHDLWGTAGDLSEEKMRDTSLGPKTGSSGSWTEGICGSLEDTTMSWFKPLNLSLILRSPPIQMSENIFGKRRVFSLPPAVFGALSCLVCWLSLRPADGAVGRLAARSYRLKFASLCGRREETKETVFKGNDDTGEPQMPSGARRELKRG